MSEVSLYPVSGQGVLLDPPQVLGRSQGPTAARMRLQDVLEHKVTQ